MTPIGCLAVVLLLQAAPPAVPPLEPPTAVATAVPAAPATYAFTILYVSSEGLKMRGGPGIWGTLELACPAPCTLGIDWSGGWVAGEQDPAKPADFQVFLKKEDITEFTCRARRCTLKASYHSGFTEDVVLKRDETLRFNDVFRVEVGIER